MMRGVAVCLACNELVVPKERKNKDQCPRCRGKLDQTLTAFEVWERTRLERRIADWHRDGVVDDEVRDKLFATRKKPLEAKPIKTHVEDDDVNVVAAKVPQDQRHAIERQADNLFSSASTFLTEARNRYTGIVAKIEADAPPPDSSPVIDESERERRRHSEDGSEAGRAVFAAQHGGAVVAAGLTALTELDDHDDDYINREHPGQFAEPKMPVKPASPPMGALQVFWFIGAILVLAGSLMGVREAWRSLEGVMRPLVIAGALFAYHVAFVALSRMLSKRSETTGRVLGVIAIGLAPVAFVAVAVAAGMSRTIGVASAAVLLAASCVTFFLVGGVFVSPLGAEDAKAAKRTASVGAGLVMGLLPCLALEVPLGGQEGSLARLLVPIAALAPLAIGAIRARVAFVRGAGDPLEKKGASSTTVAHASLSDVSAQVLASLAGAAYGAVVVALYALFGGPNQDALNVGTFGAPLLACVAWVGLASMIGWFAMAGGAIAEKLPRAAPALRIVMLAMLVGAGLTGSASALGAGRPQLIAQGLLAFAPSVVAALATLALVLESRKHSLALHFAIPVAHLAIALDAFVLIDRGPAWWVASMALVPAALLFTSPFVRSKSRRIGIGVWAIASSLIVTFLTLGVEPSLPASNDGTSPPLLVTTCVAAFLAIAAHVGGRTARPSQHYLGAVMTLISACAWFIPSRPETGWFTVVMILDGIAVVYGVLALAYGAASAISKTTTAATQQSSIDLRPFDDVSLIAATLCIYVGWTMLGPQTGPLSSRGLEGDAVGALVPTSIAAIVLALRSLRDQSRLLTLHAGLGAGVALQLSALALVSGVPVATLAQTTISATRTGTNPTIITQAATTSANAAAQGAILAGLTALLLLIPAMFRAAPAPNAAKFGRPLFGFIPMPLGARGRTVLDGFGLAAIVFAGLGCIRAAQWISAGSYLSPQRELVVLGLAAIIVAALGAFLTRGLAYVRARGHVATLAIGGVVIGITAVAYRIGRPLPPAVVGWRLTLVLAGVWLLARLIVWKGPWLAEKLERPTHGTLYHFVPHFGVLALGALLLVDALLVGGPTWTRALVITPPMLLFGGALAMLLLYRSFGWRPLLHIGLASLLLFACFVGAQGTPLGPELVPLDPPGGRWMLEGSVQAVRTAEQGQQSFTTITTFLSNAWLDPTVFLPRGDTTLRLGERAIFGTSIFAAACAALLLLLTRVDAAMSFVGGTLLGRKSDDEEEHVEQAVLVWTSAGAAVAAFALAWQPSVLAAAVLLGAGIIAIFARSNAGGVLAPARLAGVALGAPLMLHALAHTEATAQAIASGVSATLLSAATTITTALVPVWTGPAIAALALVVVLAGTEASRRAPSGRDPSMLVSTQSAAFLYGVLAITYACATAGTMQATAAFWRIRDLAQMSTDGRFAQSYALPATLGVLTIASAIGCWSWRGALARGLAIVPPALLGATAASLSAALVYTTANDVVPRTITRDGPLLGAALGFAAAIAHVAGIVLDARGRQDAAQGTRGGRDGLLLSSAGTMALFVLWGEFGGWLIANFGVIALGTSLVVAFHAIVREKSVRHVYFVELLVVALYAFVTRAMNLRPEIDAMLGLGYGFTLLGVITIARRQGLTPVADATRRFLAVLPLLVAILTMRGPATNTTAMFAIGASVLYAVVAFTEHSRAFGSLAAIAANAALLIFALAQGLDGVEIWLGPLGLLVAAISQIFAPKMSSAARSAVRITGGALLYLPSGLKLALRLGAAEDATYSVVFGAVCLLGVVAGVVLKVRAYLALATLSLTLDVVANLIYAGLRDHRLGFVILSASGLFILGVMILVTLRRERARALVGTVRSQLSGWD